MLIRLLRPDAYFDINKSLRYVSTDDGLSIETLSGIRHLDNPVALTAFNILLHSSDAQRYSFIDLSIAAGEDLSVVLYYMSRWIEQGYFFYFNRIDDPSSEIQAYASLGITQDSLIPAPYLVTYINSSAIQLSQESLQPLTLLPTDAELANIILITSSITSPEFLSSIDDLIEQGNSIQVVILTPSRILFTPIFSATSYACHYCLRHYILDADEFARFSEYAADNNLSRYNPDTQPSPLSGLISHLLRQDLVERRDRLLHPNTTGYVRSFSLHPDSNQAFHHLRSNPDCHKCSAILDAAPQFHILSELTKSTPISSSSLAYRSASASNFLQSTQYLISPLTGVVRYVKKVDDFINDDFHVYDSGHNWATRTDSLRALRTGFRTNSQGKGITDEQARAGAIAEAIERASGLFRPSDVDIRSSTCDLSVPFLSVSDLQKFSDRQFDLRSEINNEKYRFCTIPERCSDSYLLEWSTGHDLLNDIPVLIPSGLLFFHYRWPTHSFGTACSNGLSVGSSLQDAFIQGFLELVERDAVAAWWYNRIQYPGIDVLSLDSPFVSSMYSYYQSINRDLHLLDLTSDLGIPVVAAISRRNDKSREDILMAFGAHFDFTTAVHRAIGEMNQFLPAVWNVKDDGDDGYAYDDPESLSWWKSATFANQQYLMPSNHLTSPFNYFPTQPSSTLQIVEEILSICRKRNFGLYLYDYTRPDIQVPCVKVIIPQLSHFWARFSSPRLYSLPVTLGHMTDPPDEVTFNPIPMFL